MSAYEPIRSPQLDGSVWSPRLGYHLHVGLREGKLARVGISAEAHEGAILPAARDLLERLARHCAGEMDDFRDVPLALEGVSAFDHTVLTTLAREVPPGQVVTYGELARLLGRGPAAARAVGGAMARNPIPIVVPCHRVVPADRRIGNYSGEGGWETKMKLLALEGARGLWAQSQL